MEIIKSNKGKDKIIYNGYIYRKNTTNITTQSWRCEKKGCRCSASTAFPYAPGGNVVERNPHCHPPEPAHAEVLSALSQVAQQAEASDMPPRRLVSAINLSEEAQAIAPKRPAVWPA